MQRKHILRIALATGCLLLVPLLGNLFIDGWNWRPRAFAVWGTILFCTGLIYELVAMKGDTSAYRAAVGVACATGLLLFWINVVRLSDDSGIIGDGPVNLMYFGVFAVGFIGAFISRFQPRGMSRALFATAAAQVLVTLIAMIWLPAIDFSSGLAPALGLNAFFVALWLGSAWLFQKAAGGEAERGAA
jgi:hypothetical protein